MKPLAPRQLLGSVEWSDRNRRRPRQSRTAFSPAVSECLKQYRPAVAESMPSSAGFLTGVTYAVRCEALAPAGEQPWSVLVVAPDDMTIRAYFIGGLSEERCDLPRNVVVENASEVNIQLQP